MHRQLAADLHQVNIINFVYLRVISDQETYLLVVFKVHFCVVEYIEYSINKSNSSLKPSMS